MSEIDALVQRGEAGASSGDGLVPCASCGRRAADIAAVRAAFFASMSHELRTPLNGIIGFSELLEAEHFGPLNPQQRAYVGHIVTGGRQLLRLVNDVLDLARIESGRVRMQREWSSIEAMAERARTSVERMARVRGVRVEVEVEQGLPSLCVDAQRLQHAMENLVAYGVARSREGDDVRVRLEAIPGFVRISVTDGGPPIAATDFVRIFQSLDDVEEGRGDADESGLALGLTKRVVELHGGTIELDGAGARGATLRVLLPVQGDARTQVSLPPARTDAKEPFVLVVDDDPRARELIAGELRAMGVSVAFARGADEAMEIATASQPDAITLDIEMPVVSGWTALQDLKRSPKTAAIPVVVVSIADDAPRARRLGASDFLRKPLARPALAESLVRAGVTLHVLEGVKVVVLDGDNPDFDHVESKLRRAGCVVERRGARAFAHGSEIEPDVFVLDGSDEALARDVLEHRATRTPVLVIGHAAPEIVGAVARTSREDVEDFPERLVRRIRALLDERGMVGGGETA